MKEKKKTHRLIQVIDSRIQSQNISASAKAAILKRYEEIAEIKRINEAQVSHYEHEEKIGRLQNQLRELQLAHWQHQLDSVHSEKQKDRRKIEHLERSRERLKKSLQQSEQRFFALNKDHRRVQEDLKATRRELMTQVEMLELTAEQLEPAPSVNDEHGRSKRKRGLNA